MDFIRHGEPEGGSLYRGSSIDDPLSEKGWRQMWRAVGEDSHWDRLISSPLLRCKAFAQALAKRHGLPLTLEQDFREVGFGAWEGSSSSEIRATRPEEYQRFLADPVRQRPENAEDLHAFRQRVAAALTRVADEHRGKRILVIAHAGVVRAALGHVLQAPASAWYRVKVDNAGISRFMFDDGLAQLVFHNRRTMDTGGWE